MATLLRAAVLALTLLLLGVAASARPMTAHALVMSAATIAAVCNSGYLSCADSFLRTKDGGVHRDASIATINDFQKDFFLESALVAGASMSLDQNLHDPAPARQFLSATAAALPPLTSSHALDLVHYFGVEPDTEMATAVATAAYVCGYGALPGEAMQCAASPADMAAFVASELGRDVRTLATSGTAATASAPAPTAAGKAGASVVDVAKGSAAEGERIVVCHHVEFPSALYYCHRVTGTKVVRATLKAAGAGSELIKAVGICHIDTSLWLSNHPAFAALNIPRGDEACHWLVDTDIVFAPGMNDPMTE